MLRAGWESGMLRAWKLYQSVSTSGPSATVKPMPDEDVLEAVVGLGDEVQVPDPPPGDGLGEVEPLCIEASGAFLGIEHTASHLDGAPDPRVRLVEGASCGSALVLVQRAHPPLQGPERGPLAQQVGLQCRQVVEGRHALHARLGVVSQLRKLVDHRHVPSAS